jgi:ABC-type antimicrobial peptide transport system permease subunit
VLALAGVIVGLPLALWAGTFLSRLLFELSACDPAIIAATATLLLAVGSLAGYLPARRAALVDPRWP